LGPPLGDFPPPGQNFFSPRGGPLKGPPSGEKKNPPWGPQIFWGLRPPGKKGLFPPQFPWGGETAFFTGGFKRGFLAPLFFLGSPGFFLPGGPKKGLFSGKTPGGPKFRIPPPRGPKFWGGGETRIFFSPPGGPKILSPPGVFPGGGFAPPNLGGEFFPRGGVFFPPRGAPPKGPKIVPPKKGGFGPPPKIFLGGAHFLGGFF